MNEADLPQRELSPASRRYLFLINSVPYAVGAVFLWIPYALYALFEIDLLRARRLGVSNVGLVYLLSAISVTVVMAILSAISIRRALLLAESGVEVVAEINKTGWISNKGMISVTYQYAFGGQVYKKSFSCLKDEAEQYRTGAKKLVLLVDPKNPRRSKDISEIIRESVAN